MGHVEPDHVIDRRQLEQGSGQLALAAAEVEDPTGTAGGDGVDHGGEALLVEAEWAFDHFFLGVLRLRQLFGIVGVVLLQAGHRLAGQRGVVAQVAIGDQLAIGVGAQPLAATTKQLLHLVVPDPVVLVVVEDGEQDVEVLREGP